jgi:hypothetical protein
MATTMPLETKSHPANSALPPLEFGLPHDGLRLRVRSAGSALGDLVWLSAIAGTLIATTGAAVAAAGALGAMASFAFALGVATIAGGYWMRHYGPHAVVTIDREGIHDRAGGVPPLGWHNLEALEIVSRADGQAGLYARLTPEATLDRFAGWRAILALGLSPQARAGILLDGTRADRLPVPIEYLVMQLHARGAPVRAPASDFDPFEWDARWLPADAAAALIAKRLGKRARPFAAHNLDLTRTRGQHAGSQHWSEVIAALRKRDGLDAQADADEEL